MSADENVPEGEKYKCLVQYYKKSLSLAAQAVSCCWEKVSSHPVGALGTWGARATKERALFSCMRALSRMSVSCVHNLECAEGIPRTVASEFSQQNSPKLEKIATS